MLETLLTTMFKNLFFVMSLSGTVVFALYLLLYPLTKRCFSLKWRYRLLKIAMLFYLVPFPEYKYLVKGFFFDIFPFTQKIVRQFEPPMVNCDYLIVINTVYDSRSISPKLCAIYLTVLLMALISSLIIFRQIQRYRKIKQVYFFDLRGSPERKLLELFSAKKTMLDIKRNVKFACSKYCKSPITIGVLPPTVLFPIWDKDSPMDDELCEYLITHELVHIKHHDALIKLTGLLVAAIHWFNPFAYLLVSELSCISEMYCDSVVMEGKGEKERIKYIALLLGLGAKDKPLDKGQFGIGFGNFGKMQMYKRRVLEMKRNKKCKALLSVIVTAFICVAGGVTVFAYQPPVMIIESDDAAYDTTTYFSIKPKNNLSEKLVSDYFAVSDDGTIYDLYLIDKNSKASCIHNYSIRIETTKHIKNSNGGCTMNTYDGIQCSKCFATKSGNLLCTVTYISCPH